MFSSTGTRPSPPVLALPISLPPSCRSTFYRHSPRSILSADNASTSLRFRGGGVALLATDRSSKDRYFRQGVNRYRESRLRSSSSNLMQHLTFRNIFLSRGSRACDRASSSLSSSSCLVLSIMYLLSLPLFPSRAPAYWNYRYARCSTIACPSLSFLLDRTSWSETTPGWIYLHGKVSSHRYDRDEKRSSPRFTIARASSFCPPPLRSLCVSYGFLSFSRHPGKTFRNTCSATLRDAPWNVKHLAYTPSLFPSLCLSLSLFFLLLLLLLLSLHLPRERVFLRFFPPHSSFSSFVVRLLVVSLFIPSVERNLLIAALFAIRKR